jgi:hypothetical protein
MITLHRLAESIPWNQFLGSLNVYKFGLSAKSTMASLLFSPARQKGGGGGYDVMQLRSHLLSTVIENLQFELVRNFPSMGSHGGELSYFSAPSLLLNCVGNFSPAMGARNQVGIGWSYRPASLCSLATQFQTRFLESIPRPIAGLKFSTLAEFEIAVCIRRE